MADVDVDAVAAVVEALPAVRSLSGGRFGEVATYLPGRRVQGVRVRDEKVEVHVVAGPGVPLPVVGTTVRGAVLPLAGGRAVDVHVDDIDVPMSTGGRS
ncbi:MAG TPA: hypothetical protein VE760_01970 [Acidimicrobiales bacterium]|nr:hypothetical protein [Acidimicrobiales bacterium]